MHPNNLACLATPIPALIPAGQQWRFYYFAGSQRIAMRYCAAPRAAQRREGKGPNVPNAYTFFLSDHLGSTTLTVLPSGVQAGRMLYRAFGEERPISGTMPTNYRFTGQLSQPEAGLYYYGARWYDPVIGRFTKPDTLVPLESNE